MENQLFIKNEPYIGSNELLPSNNLQDEASNLFADEWIAIKEEHELQDDANLTVDIKLEEVPIPEFAPCTKIETPYLVSGGDVKVAKIWQQRIFSGIQPTGSLHLGNYFGAVQKWVEMQDSGEDVLYSIVDLHSITLPQDPRELRSNILKVAATLIACGIDPDKSILFQQSKVHQHAELCWILGCMTTMARLAHLPQFKEKSSTVKDVPLGLYVYPVLQCADILLYRATEVPVGEDQVQHLQLAQHLARNFNNQYGTVFPIPRTLVGDSHMSRLKSLRDPLKKMSKSEPDSKSRINLTDTSDAILEKCKKAVTDFTSALTFSPEERPGVSNLITIHSLLSGKPPQQICEECARIDTGRYKLVVAEVIEEKLKPIREKNGKTFDGPFVLAVRTRERS